MQTLLLVYNDAVTALVSGTDGQLDGCVLIAGTGPVFFCAPCCTSWAKPAFLPPPLLDLPCLHTQCSADQTRHTVACTCMLGASGECMIYLCVYEKHNSRLHALGNQLRFHLTKHQTDGEQLPRYAIA